MKQVDESFFLGLQIVEEPPFRASVRWLVAEKT